MTKPSSGWKKPKGSSVSTEMKKDADGFSTDKPTKRVARLDPISEVLGVTNENYFVKMRWAWLRKDEYGVQYPLEVDRYYPDRSLAIDIDTQDEELSTFKRKLLESHGIQYVRFQDLHSWNDLKIFNQERSVQ